MTDRATALEFAFEKLVEQLQESGALNAARLADELEAPAQWLGVENEGTDALAELARRTRRTADMAQQEASAYPASEWELMAQLMLQYLLIQGQLNSREFADYLDVCFAGMRQHGAPLHLQGVVARLSDYSRGTEQLPEWLRDAPSLRASGPDADATR